MGRNKDARASVFWGCNLMMLWVLLYCRVVTITGTETDVYCLRTLKESLQDTLNSLRYSWDFNNNTEGFICRFAGVECWHPDENRVLNIKLSDMGLKGRFPRSLKNCSTMTGLDFSNNQLYGSMPADINDTLKFVTNLDLSNNNFSGEIPANLSGCNYLNSLKLDHNRFTGQIPSQLSMLNRLKTFTVAGNLLTGQVPNFDAKVIKADSYVNNSGLCGGPLPACREHPSKSNVGIIAGAAVGGATFAAIVAVLGLLYIFRRRVSVQKEEDPEQNKWALSIKGTKGIKVSMFENSVSKMRLSDLMKATNNFSKDNIIGDRRTGTMYKARLESGTSLIIKRLHNSQHSEKEFSSEMATLGKVKHQNLVTLLGFCMTKKEKLLVYKHMPNGSLYDCLHATSDDIKPLEWSLRVKIGIGAARGLAWLHHNCNPRIIHRNISSKCIYLDGEFEPKISDFGLARLMNPVDTHLSTFVNGEFGDLGYVAPEYARTLMATPKGDVYSFGVVLLELVTGEKPTHVTRAPESFKGNLVEWALWLSEKSQLVDTIDPSLAGDSVKDEVMQFLKVACNCVVQNPKERLSMFEVHQFLRAIGERYHFSVDDEIMLPTDTGDVATVELIVSREA